jgi:hypothetical protein
VKLAIVAVLLSSATAFADRQMVTTIGATFAATSYADNTQTTDLDGGARITLSFEDAPLPIAPAGLLLHETRLVPELFAGFYMNDVRARSQVGAGLRGEVWLSRRGADDNAGFHMRMAAYLAARAKISGPDAKPGAEFMLGEYILTDHGCRFGWEGGIGLIKRTDLDSGASPELEALVNVFIGR